jgi:hypothetical protein
MAICRPYKPAPDPMGFEVRRYRRWGRIQADAFCPQKLLSVTSALDVCLSAPSRV